MSNRSGYRLMWALCMFDLPVLTKPERKRATRFRKELLELGFQMTQFSVYLRFCGSFERYKAMEKKVTALVPPHGRVHMLRLTDKQYAAALMIDGGYRAEKLEKPDQLALF